MKKVVVLIALVAMVLVAGCTFNNSAANGVTGNAEVTANVTANAK